MNHIGRILVVGNSEVLCEALRSLGFTEIDTAENGAEAFDRLLRQSYEAVFADWKMPFMSGLELLVSMRIVHNWWTIPVFLLTTSEDRNVVHEVRRLDAKVITWPFGPGCLEREMRQLL